MVRRGGYVKVVGLGFSDGLRLKLPWAILGLGVVVKMIYDEEERRVGRVLATRFFSLDSFSPKPSSFSSTLVTLAQINHYGNNIFHISLFLDGHDS